MKFWMLFTALFCAAPAWADAVMPPPNSCPAGSTGVSSHGGPHCQPTTCESTAECTEGGTCGTQGLCIETREGSSMGGPFTFEAAVDVCFDASDCNEDAECVVADRCVKHSGCYCDATTFSAAGLVLGPLLLLTLATRRRK